ncbi:MAG: hypothetical protein ACJ8F7_12770 [Gemmataceae bacterium]
MRFEVWGARTGGEHRARVLVPECAADRDELLRVLDELGVRRRSFSHGGLLGRLDFPDAPVWAHDGAIRLPVASVGQVRPVDVWFWVVEATAGAARRCDVHWSLSRDPETAVPWETANSPLTEWLEPVGA